MQSYTDTMSATTTTTSTGMTLRSGKTYYKTDTQYGRHTYELDGEDFIPLSSLTEFGWTWAQKVHEAVGSTEWTAETAYEFLGYLEATSSNWCSVAWQTESQDTHEFGQYLMSLVRDFSDEATSIKRYPNTRNKQNTFGEDIGYCNGIIRLANEIETEWNVSALMHQSDQDEIEDAVMELDSSPPPASFDNTVIDYDYDYKSQGGYGHA